VRGVAGLLKASWVKPEVVCRRVEEVKILATAEGVLAPWDVEVNGK
jgi:hypothetical protein